MVKVNKAISTIHVKKSNIAEIISNTANIVKEESPKVREIHSLPVSSGAFHPDLLKDFDKKIKQGYKLEKKKPKKHPKTFSLQEDSVPELKKIKIKINKQAKIKISPKVKQLLEDADLINSRNFKAKEIKQLGRQITELYNPENKDFIESLIKDNKLDKFDLKMLFGSMQKEKIKIYECLYKQVMPDGTKRFTSLIIGTIADFVESKDPVFLALNKAVDGNGNPRLSGHNLVEIHRNLVAQELISSNSNGIGQLSDLGELNEESIKNVRQEITKLLNLRNLDGKLLTGDQIHVLTGLELINNKFKPEKMLNLKSIEDLSISERKELMYAFEKTNLQRKTYIQMIEKQGFNVEKFLPSYEKLNLPFVEVDRYSNFDTKKLADSIVHDSKRIIKVRSLKNPAAVKAFETGMSDLEDIFRTGFINVADIKPIKLEYPRNAFINDVKQVITGLSQEESKEFTRVFGFELSENDLVKYPVTATPLEISQIENKKVRLALEKFNSNVERFTTGNRVFIPESPELEETLNQIVNVFPEFLTSVGKVQHGAHEHTLDIHMLKTLQEAVADPKWSKLTEKNKKLARIAILFHDITKQEGAVDKSHPFTSAQDVFALLSKLDMPEIDKDRIFDLIKNHHWLEQINQPMTQDEAEILGLKLATEFRRPNDWKIAKIFARADLKATGNYIYETFISALDLPIVSQIGKNVKRIHNCSVFVPRTRIPKASQLRNISESSISSPEGTTNNKVIFLTEKTNLTDLGFDPNVTLQNFRAFAHIVRSSNKGFLQMLDAVIQNKSDVFSTSYVTGEKMNTLFSGKKSKILLNNLYSNMGIIVETDHNNIAAVYPQDMDSGRMKTLTDLMGYLFINDVKQEDLYLKLLKIKTKESIEHANYIGDLTGIQHLKDIKNDEQKELVLRKFFRRINHRNYWASKVKETLGLSNKKYRKLIREVSQYRDINEIENPKVKNAIIKASESLMDRKNAPDYKKLSLPYTWNEAVIYAPKVQAIFAKDCRPEKIPFELRKYAQEKDLPIIIFNKQNK